MGILTSLFSPGGWIGDILKSALTGPIVGGLVDSYKAKLNSGQAQDQMLADLAARELEVERREVEVNAQLVIADEGRWWTAAPRAIVCWSVAVYFGKVLVWDICLHLGSTAALHDPLIVDVFSKVVVVWFGGRTIEKVTKIISNRFAR
jgi:hypothetical protein